MRIILLISISFLIFSCKKSEDRNCVKSTGTLTSKEILLNDFDLVYMGPHIKYKLIQDTIDKVVINGGENIIGEIEVNVDANKLTVENNNKCAFLRSYDDVVEVEIHFINIVNIEFEGTHEVICQDTLQLNDLALAIRDGAGAFELKLNANSLNLIIAHGWGNYNVSGNVNFAKFQVGSNGFGNSNDLNVLNELIVITSSVGLVEVNAEATTLLAEINSSGNINYIGVPISIEFNNYGTGNLIDNN